MQMIINTGGIAATNAYLIADEQSGQAVIFDAPDHTVAPLVDEAVKRGWDVVGLWLTHGHFDHLADHAVVTNKFPNAKVLIHQLDEPKHQKPGTKMFPLTFSIAPRNADAHVIDGQKLQLGSMEVEVIHTPGHSPGHVMYYFPKQSVLIGGDLIIGSSVGRTDLPDADHAVLQNSIRRIMQLPPQTQLLPGHGGSSTLADEMRDNPYVQEAMRAGEAG
jgi:glyoxylase-like metal-dependent hydrolase (beta-lactamase superfamily II)